MTVTDLPIEPDVRIVGAGIAGGMVADVIAEAGHTVLLLESGPRLERQQLVENWRTTARTDFMAPYPQPDHAPAPNPNNWGDYLIQTRPDPYHQ